MGKPREPRTMREAQLCRDGVVGEVTAWLGSASTDMVWLTSDVGMRPRAARRLANRLVEMADYLDGQQKPKAVKR